MDNVKLADTLDTIADLLEIKGEIIYKTIAYRKAAENIRNLPDTVQNYWEQHRLTDIPGVGKAIADKMDELLRTGSLSYLEDLKKEVPVSLIQLLQIPDIGPKRVALFWKDAQVTNLQELKTAAESGRLNDLPGMSTKSVQRLLQGIDMLNTYNRRMLLDTAWNLADQFLMELRIHEDVKRAEAAGSLRRYKATIGDIDLVIASDNPRPVMDWFTRHPDVHQVKSQGTMKSSVILKNGVQVQLWSQPPARFGTLLQFVTGSKEHNVRLREYAQKKGWSINEQAITDAQGNEKYYADEAEMYTDLGMAYIPPELREDRGEIEAALNHALPELVSPEMIQADLHIHSHWSDGKSSIEELARTAIARGYHTIAITDHSQSAKIANGLNHERLMQQRQEIDQVQTKLGNQIRILQGSEVEIKADGSLDFPDEILAGLDIVIASLHSSLTQEREIITERLLKAIRNPHVDIIGHLSGRLMPHRPEADLDFEAVLSETQKTGVILEIDSNAARLDMDEKYARKASEMGIHISIDSDAHAPQHLDWMKYGVSVARRAWVKPDLIVNTWSSDQIIQWLEFRNPSKRNL